MWLLLDTQRVSKVHAALSIAYGEDLCCTGNCGAWLWQVNFHKDAIGHLHFGCCMPRWVVVTVLYCSIWTVCIIYVYASLTYLGLSCRMLWQ